MKGEDPQVTREGTKERKNLRVWDGETQNPSNIQGSKEKLRKTSEQEKVR